MDRFFSMDNKFFTFMGKVADLFILNILCLICCIPIVTAGASITAMFYVTMKMVKNEESYIIKSFFKSFKPDHACAGSDPLCGYENRKADGTAAWTDHEYHFPCIQRSVCDGIPVYLSSSGEIL